MTDQTQGTDVTQQPVEAGLTTSVPQALSSTQAITAASATNALAVTALILGILGVILSFLIPFVNYLVAIPAIVFGAVGLSKAKQGASGRGLTLTGLILGIAGMVIPILIVLVFAGLFAGAVIGNT